MKAHLHKDSPMENWEKSAQELSLKLPEPISGEDLRKQTLLADELLEELFKEEG